MATNEVKETKPAAEAKAPEAKAEAKTSFDVLTAGGTLARTYTVEEHGPKAGELAAEYAGKIQGSVK